jgi:ABC-type sugar transport system substrate-binding protein
MRKFILGWLLVAMLVVVAGCAPVAPGAPAPAAGATPAAADEQITIVVSMKGPGAGNPFWAAVEAGALAKGEELGVTVNVMAPPQESDVASQISQIEDALAQGVDGIAIAVTDPDALTPVLERAIADGVPVVYIDTRGNMEDVTFIGTNNAEGAKLAADYICENVEAGSDVAILQGLITQSTGQARATGSKSGLEACGLNVVAEQPANWDRAEAVTVMENILTGNPNIRAVFASNDNMALGAVEAIKNAGLGDQIMVVGFDANPDAAASVLAGDMAATIAQNPTNMGGLGVESVFNLINGETLEPVIDTGTVLVTAENAAEYE